MLKLSSVNKSYGKNQVIFDLDIEIGNGEIVGLLGPNGAGKSTTMKIMTGFLIPDSGSVTIDGESILDNNDLKSRIGYLPETNPLYLDMGVDEFLAYSAELKGVENVESEVDRVLQLVGLKDKKANFISTLSKGYRQRVGLASALIGDPDILILDEPTEGLDPGQRDEIKRLITELGKDRTIIISSHVLSEISSVINRVMILSEGKVKYDDKIENVALMQEGRMKLYVVYEGPLVQDSLISEFNDIEVNIGDHGSQKRMEIFAGNDIRKDLFNYLKKSKIDVYEFFSEKQSLEDVFFDITN